jgi:hypothetical protein
VTSGRTSSATNRPKPSGSGLRRRVRKSGVADPGWVRCRPLLGRLDSIEALRAWRDLLVELQRQRRCEGGCPIGSLGSELSELDPDARTDLAAGFGRWETPIREGLHAMKDRGDLQEGADPDQLALATLAALQGGLLLTQVRRDTAALDAMITHIASLTTPDTASRGPTVTRGASPAGAVPDPTAMRTT